MAIVDKQIVALVKEDQVTTIAAVHFIVALTCADGVKVVAAIDRVVPTASGKCVVTIASFKLDALLQPRSSHAVALVCASHLINI